jgi:hypothetical protein
MGSPSMEPFVHGLGEWLFTTDGTRFRYTS